MHLVSGCARLVHQRAKLGLGTELVLRSRQQIQGPRVRIGEKREVVTSLKGDPDAYPMGARIAAGGVAKADY
ncbi:MAG TPA: hypothetical protein DIU15_20680 [Deltaproteobacteria bacterium]|nr:hypothetical protein [Deltaproteobacteria bacterium]HCP48465.1 hypothetical protein [Deltaproteobacteria bacterium]